MKYHYQFLRFALILICSLSMLNLSAVTYKEGDYCPGGYFSGAIESTSGNKYELPVERTFGNYNGRLILKNVKSITLKIVGKRHIFTNFNGGYNVWTSTIKAYEADSESIVKDSSSQSDEAKTITYEFDTTGEHFIKIVTNYDSNTSSPELYILELEVDAPGKQIDDENGDYVIYSITEDNEATVSCIGHNNKRCVIQPSIDYEGNVYEVTSIASSACPNNSSLQSVVIPSTITSIGENAFSGCSNLYKVILEPNIVPNGISDAFEPLTGRQTYVGNHDYDEYSSVLGTVNVYSNLSSKFEQGGVFYVPIPSSRIVDAIDCDYTTANVNVPNNVQLVNGSSSVSLTVNDIKAHTFRDNSVLTTLSVGGSVKKIGQNAVTNCSSLKEFTLYTGNDAITIETADNNNPLFKSTPLETIRVNRDINCSGKAPFSENNTLKYVYIAGKCHEIGSNDFSNSDVIEIVDINGELNTIGSLAFANKTSLTDVAINGINVEIGDMAFSGCTAMKNLSLGSSIQCVGARSFNYCSKIATGISLGQSQDVVIGDGAFYNCALIPSITLGNNVTSIGNKAFYGCSRINRINLCEKLTYIGYGAFQNCSNIGSVVWPTQITTIKENTFMGCSSLSNVTLPSTLVSLGAHALDGTAITSLVLPDGVSSLADYVVANTPLLSFTITPLISSIGDGAFDNCSQLAELTIEQSASKLTLGKNADREGLFHDCQINNLYIGRTLSYEATAAAGYSPFYGNTSLKNVTVSENATTVPAYMFAECTGLETATLGEMVQSIGTSAFENSGLININIPHSVTGISASCFKGCSRLAEITLHDRVSQIGVNAFASSSIQTIEVPGAVETISTGAFSDTRSLQSVFLNHGTKTIDTYAFSNSALPSLSVPNTITAINTAAFDGADNLHSLRFEDGTSTLTLGNSADYKGLFTQSPLTSLYIGRELSYNASAGFGYSPFYRNATLSSVEIGDIPSVVFPYEFYGCTSLNDIVMGDNVQEIGDYAFGGCTNLTNFTVGTSIESLGIGALSDCTKLEVLKTYSTVPPFCGAEALSDINKILCVLYIPNGTTDFYSAADQWNEFFFVEEFEAGVNASYIEISPATVTLNVGETLRIEAEVYPETALVRTVDWTSTDTDVAIVNAQGVVTALAEGQTNIVATAKDGSAVTATCLITVFNPNKPTPYLFTVDNTGLSASRTNLLAVSLKNEDPVTSFQCDIHLPEGVEIEMDNRGRYMFTKSERLDDTFVVTSSNYDEGVRLLVYSSQNMSTEGNDGVLFYIPLKLTDASTAVGTTYTMTITDISVTLSADFSEVMLPQVDATLTVAQAYTPGDVNNDGRFSAADVSIAVSYVLGDNPANGVREAADVNGDGRISAADVSIIVSYVLAGHGSSAPALAPKTEAATMSINSNGTLKLCLSNLNNYVAAQMDVRLPAGVVVKAVRPAEANADNHMVNWAMLPDGRLRLLSYSPYNREFRSADSFVEIEVEKYDEISGEEFGVESILITGIEYIDGKKVFAEYGAEGFTKSLDVSGIPDVNVGEGCTVTVNGQSISVTPDSEGNVAFCDMLGRLIRHNIASGGNSINLMPGVYVVNGSKIYVE